VNTRATENAAQVFQQAVALFSRGSYELAEGHCRRVLSMPGQNVFSTSTLHADSLQLLAVIELQTGRPQEGIEHLTRSIALNPNQPNAHSNLGNAFLQVNRPEQALASFDQALRLAPGLVAAHFNRGNALRELSRFSEALASYDRALQRQPNFVQALNNRGGLLLILKRPAEALRSYDQSHALEPKSASALCGRAGALLDLNRPEEALRDTEHALRLTPDDVTALCMRSKALRALQRYDEAILVLQYVLQADPSNVSALNDCGTVLADRDRLAEAEACYRRALQIAPERVEILANLANAQTALGRPAEALVTLERALQSQPNHPDTLYNYAANLLEVKRFSEGASVLRRVVELAPERDYALGLLLQTQLRDCDWSDYEAKVGRVSQRVMAGERADTPFTGLAVLHSAEAQLVCARTFAADRYPPARDPRWRGERYGHERIRIAYISADLRDHVVSYLMAGVFEAHDKRRFETFGVSLRREEPSEIGQRVKRAFEHFVDVSEKTDTQIARLLREWEVDIAVDLMGITQGHRTRILAHRPAPAQVNYLGFPGTMGTSCIDYILADEFLIPLESRRYYAEHVVYLPGCFQANDDRRPLQPSTAERSPHARAQACLPPDGLVLCCFNSSYKLNPPLFDIWCELLRDVPNTTLWLVREAASCEHNLRREAQLRGVAPERLVFAPRLPYADHLARLQLADLFLDTLPFNAGATASDALWAGVPVLTCTGEALAGRMAGSLLKSLGLDELITSSLGEYRKRAIQLLRQPSELAVARAKLAAGSLRHSVFDTQHFCGNLEQAYHEMWRRTECGQSPESFAVAAIAERTRLA